MKLLSFTYSILLAGLAAASTKPVGEWTISNARRTKSQSNTLCTWHFSVADNSSGANANNTFNCDFNVAALSGTDCGFTSFQSACSGNDSFTVNGGHSSMGFVVLVLVNNDQESQAYFGFSDGDLDTHSEIAKQTKPVYPQGITQRSEIAVRQQSDVNAPSATEWAVEDLFRDVDVQKHTVTVGFRILDGSEGGSRCMLTLTPPEGTDMQSWEWFNRPCQGSGYFASWGYTPTNDAGVMTIVNSTRNGQAFFGFSNIKSSSYLGDAGPNPVSPCSCG